MIDYDKPLDEDGERYETFFLNLVDSRDLVDIVGELEEREPEVIYVTPEPTAVAAPVTTTQEKETDSTTMLLIVLIVAVAGGGIFLYMKQSKASQKPVEPDFGFDDEDDDEETVNEDA